MNDAKSPQEPSMEEILASIRRIISEDTDAPKSAAPAAPAMGFEDDVLELTDRFDEPAAPAPSHGANLFDEEDDFPSQAAPKFSLDDQDDEGFMSHSAVNATANAFASLDEEPEPEPEPYQAPAPVAVGGALTVEQLVRETLKPILKDWLDRNLPPMVEQIVRSEIERANRRR